MLPLKRSHQCGLIRESLIGEEVILTGWAQKRRDHGGSCLRSLLKRS